MDQWNVYLNPDLTVAATDSGTLDGLTFAIKDVFAIKGHTCSAGNPDWLRTHQPAEHHSATVERLLRNGAKLCGTTITDELMFSINGENTHYGTPVNPADPGRIPGGSSSGSAVAVAAELADFAIGTDTGGSVRVPSSYCGVYGIRPTHDAVNVEGLIPLARSFDTVGWMARDARTLLAVGLALLDEPLTPSGTATSVPSPANRLLLDEISTPSARTNETLQPNQLPANIIANSGDATNGFTRLLIADDMWNLGDEATRAALSACLPYLSELVTEGESVTLADDEGGLNQWKDAFRTIQGYEIWQEHGSWITETRPAFGADIGSRFQWASTIGISELDNALAVRQAALSRMASLLDDRTIIVAPTTPSIAPMKNGSGEEIELRRQQTFQLCCVAGLGGLPQVTLPLLGENDLPVGLSFIAARGQDLKLLRWLVTVADELPRKYTKSFKV